MRKLLIGAALASLAVPAVSFAQNSTTTSTTPSAESQCRQQRDAIGKSAFGDLYGTNAGKTNALGKCVSAKAKANRQANSDAANACRTEQTADATAFTKKYGTGKNGKNAYGKCVSAKAKAQSVADQKATISAAKSCKAERALDPAAFKAKYGTNANKANAFGKCVSAKAKA
ncbi:MAG: hypothetical protein JWO74_2263 [Solirubrobacterales bacterium]|nr:hypothetical protein [Solirubrobacterales bacterium]